MPKLQAALGALVACSIFGAQATPVPSIDAIPAVLARAASSGGESWKNTLSDDTRHRLEVAQKHLDDQTTEGQAFRNDTIMRVNIEREALDMSLIDLHQAFGMTLPSARPEISANHKRSDAEDMREFAYLRGGAMSGNDKRSDAEDMREFAYLRGGAMSGNDKRGNAEDMREFSHLRGGAMLKDRERSTAADEREFAYLRGGTMTQKRSDAEDAREFAYLRGGTMTANEKRSDAEDMREFMYLRGGTMTANQKRNDAEDMREFAYLRGGKMTANEKRDSDSEDMREFMYLRGGTMTANEKRDSDSEDMREFMYLRGGTMTANEKRDSDAEDMREFAYLRGGKMTANSKRDASDESLYGSLLNRDSLALGAIERVNIAHRVSGKPELTKEEADAMGSEGDNWAANYWRSSMKHGDFWTTDQATGKPNFIDGGQGNGFGFIQSTYHKLHCLANIRMMLAWQITGNGNKMSNDMNVHAIHCLEYIRSRELANADLNQEPIDTVDYKGMGIH